MNVLSTALRIKNYLPWFVTSVSGALSLLEKALKDLESVKEHQQQVVNEAREVAKNALVVKAAAESEVSEAARKIDALNAILNG